MLWRAIQFYAVYMQTSRRQFLSFPALAAGQAPSTRAPRIVCVGGHPDDPESGCAGTLVRYVEKGSPVTIIYLTRGEAGISGKSHQEASAIRTAECEAACKIIGAKPLFAGQIDGAAVVDKDAAAKLAKLNAAEQPDVIFTQWTIDTHLDHQAASILSYRAWLSMRSRCELYFYEVDLGAQTMGFRPTDYVDITAVRDKKKAALFAHKSQNADRIYSEHHEVMENFRGRECGVKAAEAFVRLSNRKAASSLPG